MTSKERMLLAINRQKPDRLPVTIHQWQAYHLKKYMRGMSDIEANVACGLDASITVYDVEEFPSHSWKQNTLSTQSATQTDHKHTIQTPDGALSWAQASNSQTIWVTEHLVKKPEDIHLLRKYRPIPKLKKDVVVKTYDQLGDAGILRTFVWGLQGGCWQDACELFGVENLIFATFDDPDWVHEFLSILLEQKLQYIEQSLPGLPIDLVETGGGASSNTVISPAIHKEFCLPYDQKLHDALHAIGHKVVYHTCGGMTKITDSIAANHCDVSETLSPSTVGGDIQTAADAKLVYDALHPTLGLIGGMDQFNTLELQGKHQIEKEVETLFQWYGQEGGYILSASDHFFEASPENIISFANAAKRFTY